MAAVFSPRTLHEIEGDALEYQRRMMFGENKKEADKWFREAHERRIEEKLNCVVTGKKSTELPFLVRQQVSGGRAMLRQVVFRSECYQI